MTERHEQTALWHPFADMSAVARDGELVLARGQGARVWDEGGTEYLDATAGLWFVNVGHGRQQIADAIAGQAARLASYHTFGDVANRPALDLAARVSAIAPVPDSKVFFTSGGSDAVDTALKLVRRYWHQVGQPERTVVVVRDKAYHGMHMAGTSLAGIDDNRSGYGDLDPDVVRVPWDDAAALAKTIDEIGVQRVAAFFCEPVIGAGGVFAAGPQYLADVRQVCAERDVLYVSDEVVTGFGRTGAWYASTRFGLEPDLVLCAKGITSGYVPLGAVVVAPRVAEPFWSPEPGAATIWRHGYTYSGHAVAAAAGLAALDILEREALADRALQLEATLAEALLPLAELPAVAQVRAGTGVLAAVQLVDAALVPPVVAGLRAQGVLTRGLWGGALQISPPLVITDGEVAELASALRTVLEAQPVSTS